MDDGKSGKRRCLGEMQVPTLVGMQVCRYVLSEYNVAYRMYFMYCTLYVLQIRLMASVRRARHVDVGVGVGNGRVTVRYFYIIFTLGCS